MNRPKKRRTQAERTAASDKAMFRAAIKLIARDGPNDMTLTKLGKEAGFSGGLVSYRFGSKSKLLKATAERILELWEERVLNPAHATDPGLENIKLIAKLYLDAVATKSDLMMAQYRLMQESYGSCKELQPTFRKFDRTARTHIAEQLQASVDAGEVRADVNLELFATTFIGVLRGTAVQYFIDSRSVDPKAVYEVIAQSIDRLLKN